MQFEPTSVQLKPEIDVNAKPIEEERFWKLIDSVAGEFDHQERRRQLQEKVSDWSEDDLKGFKLQYIEQFNKLNRKDIYNVFTLINQYPDKEAFFSFRDQLISWGVRIFSLFWTIHKTCLSKSVE